MTFFSNNFDRRQAPAVAGQRPPDTWHGSKIRCTRSLHLLAPSDDRQIEEKSDKRQRECWLFCFRIEGIAKLKLRKWTNWLKVGQFPQILDWNWPWVKYSLLVNSSLKLTKFAQKLVHFNKFRSRIDLAENELKSRFLMFSMDKSRFSAEKNSEKWRFLPQERHGFEMALTIWIFDRKSNFFGFWTFCNRDASNLGTVPR